MSNEMILYRDLRTTSCQSTYNDNDDISENCDKIEQIRRKNTSFRAHKNQSSKFPTSKLTWLAINVEVVFFSFIFCKKKSQKFKFKVSFSKIEVFKLLWFRTCFFITILNQKKICCNR